MTQGTLSGVDRIQARLQASRDEGRSALIPFVVSGRPTRERFLDTLRAVDAHADLIELGVPFSDPVADGPVIAEAARRALAEGVTLAEVLGDLETLELRSPTVLFSYLNPLLAGGLTNTMEAAARAGVSGVVVPDLTLLAGNPEAEGLDACTRELGLAWIQIVTPATGQDRRDEILRTARGFLYAALRTGITGARTDEHDAAGFLASLRDRCPVPVCAGFGLRDVEQARVLREHADGLIVGTALVDAIERGDSPSSFLRPLFEAARRSTT